MSIYVHVYLNGMYVNHESIIQLGSKATHIKSNYQTLTSNHTVPNIAALSFVKLNNLPC